MQSESQTSNAEFVWPIRIPASLTMGWRWRNTERSGWEPFEWVITLDCAKYRHSSYMSRCRVCGEKHEAPIEVDKRWAFRWYPMQPSIRALQQWERRIREHEISVEYQAAINFSNPFDCDMCMQERTLCRLHIKIAEAYPKLFAERRGLSTRH